MSIKNIFKEESKCESGHVPVNERHEQDHSREGRLVLEEVKTEKRRKREANELSRKIDEDS